MISLGLDRVAERLGHLASLLVHEEAVRDHGAIGRPAARAEADEQRTLEPAAILVRAFDVEVGRPRQLLGVAEHRLVARARVEPHVEDVALALELAPAALRAREPVGQELLDRALVPRVGAVLGGTPPRPSRPSAPSAPPRRTSRSRPPGSARPTPAAARCTSRAGWRASASGAPRPTPGSSARASPPRPPSRAGPCRPSPRTTATWRGRSPGGGSASSAGTSARTIRGARGGCARAAPPRSAGSRRTPAGRRTAPRPRGSARRARPARRCRGRTARPSRSRRSRVPAPCARRPSPVRA